MIRKELTIAIFIMILCTPRINSRIFTGGNVSINYNNGVYADVAPILGYRIEKLQVGVSPFFSYSRVKKLNGVYTYGARTFTRYDIYKGIFAHAEFGVENTPDLSTETKSDRTWVMSLPMGMGYEQIIAKKVRVHAMILYDFLLNENSTKENPTIRVGATYDF